MSTESISHMLKCVALGDGAVGKSSIVQRFIRKKFVTDYKMTVGVDVLQKEIAIKDGVVTLSIWDIAGQEHYNFMRSNFYYGSDGIVLVFDLTRPPTFENCKKWIDEIHKALGARIPCMLIGNKADLLEDTGIVIDPEMPRVFAEKESATYIETSAKTGLNIDEIFSKLAQKIVDLKTYSVDMFSKLWESSFKEKE